MLSNSDIEALEDILFAEPWGDEALDFSVSTALSVPASSGQLH